MILTVTLNPAVDHTIRIEEQPHADTVHRASVGGRYDAGGKGINVSQYLAALDTETVATGLLGGFTGEYIRSVLAASPFETAFAEVAEPTRVNTTVLAPDGEYKFNEQGPTATAETIDELVAGIDELDPDRVAVAGSLPPGLGPESIDRIAAAGAWKTSVDVGGALLTSLSGRYETCKPNESELAEAVGREIETPTDAAEAARELLEYGYERVVTSLGPDGAILVTRETAIHAEALETEVVDTVGAGDSLFAGVLSGLDRGESEADALRSGIALASAVVATQGTSPPSRDRFVDRRSSVRVSTMSLATE